jgi:hypothetical protein
MKFLRRTMLFAPDDGAPSGGGETQVETLTPETQSETSVETQQTEIPTGDPEPASGQTVPLKALLETQRKYQEVREQLAYLQGVQATAPAAPVQQAPVAPSGPPPEPKVEDFESYEDFQVAERRHIIDVAKFELKQDFTHGQSVARQQEQRERAAQTFQERLLKAAELDPDLPVIVSTFHLPGPNHIPLSGQMQDAIQESEVGPQLLRYFANNKAEATRLSALNPTSALREIGRIEAAIINKPAPPVKHVTSAPEPIKTVGSGGSVEVDEDTLPMSEYLARERLKKDALRGQSQRR